MTEPQDEATIRQYLADIGEYEPLSGDDELRLLVAIERGATARDELSVWGHDSARRELSEKVAEGQAAQQRTLTQSNLRLVIEIAREYEATGRSLLALVQEGNLGLLRGIETFDWRTGRSFRDHLVSTIRGAITSSTE